MSYIPTWVYFLFLGILYLGIVRCFPRTMSVKRLVALPILFLAASLHTTFQWFAVSTLSVLCLVIGWVVGYGISHLHVRYQTVQADKQHYLIRLPGSILILILMLFAFFIEFFVNFAIDAQWPIEHSIAFMPVVVFLSGTIAGITVGRNVIYFLKYRKAASVDLSSRITP